MPDVCSVPIPSGNEVSKVGQNSGYRYSTILRSGWRVLTYY